MASYLGIRRSLVSKQRPMIAGALPQTPVAQTTGPYTEQAATTAFDNTARYAGQIGQDAVRTGYERTRDFDPSKALNEYARGAWGEILTGEGGIKDQLRDLRGQAVGAGRLDTGFFDEDQGAVIRRGMSTFGNQLAQQSMNATALMQRNNQALYGIGAEQQGVSMDALASRREEMINARREQQERRRKRKRGIAGAIGGVLGGVGGFLVGGPAGAAAGYKIGSGIGQGVAS